MKCNFSVGSNVGAVQEVGVGEEGPGGSKGKEKGFAFPYS